VSCRWTRISSSCDGRSRAARGTRGSPVRVRAAGPGTSTGADVGLSEAARLEWRPPTSERSLRRTELLWSAWTTWVKALFTAPGVALLWIEPLAFPAAFLCFAHAWAVPRLQARHGGRVVLPIGSERSAARRAAADEVAEAICSATSSGTASATSLQPPESSSSAESRHMVGWRAGGDPAAGGRTSRHLLVRASG
jgi:hypothetical protein